MDVVNTIKILILFLIKCAIAQVIVELPNGLIQGRTSLTPSGVPFYAFQKIPFAAPPVNNLRFKAPIAPANWDGILDTTHFDVVCYQVISNSDLESEDCLYLNVYTPQLPSDNTENASLPVMFYVYGGGFISGNCLESLCGPDYLIEQNVVIVTINYRVGPFGFLSTEDSVIPGNNGLKDQYFALKWTHDNIYLFGGDPEKIIIFGQSAGSASVTYQLLNSKSEGLFRGAICQSGSYLSPWAYQRRAREIAFKTAGFINETFNDSGDSQALLDFLLNVSAKELDDASSQINLMQNYQLTQLAQGFFYAPVIEPEHEDAFLTEKMYVNLKEGNFIKVPLLIGINSEESLGYGANLEDLQARMEAYDNNLDWLVPDDMHIEDIALRKETGSAIRKIYATDGGPLAADPANGVRYASDDYFTRPIIKQAELQSSFTPIYFYQFSYHSEMALWSFPEVPGCERVTHAEELGYLWRINQDGYDNSDLSVFPVEDVITLRRMVKIWTNFAKDLNPTPEVDDLLQNITWPLVSPGPDFWYVDIGENLEIKNHPKEIPYKGWNAVYASLGYDDFDTY